ncbi:hypothetical protein AAZX31_05G104900 [Glycine max]
MTTSTLSMDCNLSQLLQPILSCLARKKWLAISFRMM